MAETVFELVNQVDVGVDGPWKWKKNPELILIWKEFKETDFVNSTAS